jgi:hypothetical protein
MVVSDTEIFSPLSGPNVRNRKGLLVVGLEPGLTTRFVTAGFLLAVDGTASWSKEKENFLGAAAGAGAGENTVSAEEGEAVEVDLIEPRSELKVPGANTFPGTDVLVLEAVDPSLP